MQHLTVGEDGMSYKCLRQNIEKKRYIELCEGATDHEMAVSLGNRGLKSMAFVGKPIGVNIDHDYTLNDEEWTMILPTP